MKKAIENDNRVVKKALVLGHHTPSFLSVIRSLGRGGVQVHVAWYRQDSIALYSRYVYKAHDIPPYNMDSNEWKEALINLMKEEKFDLVIPCHDEMVFPIQRHMDELRQYGRLYVINNKSFEVLFDKVKTNELVRSLGVNVPDEIVVSQMKDVNGPLSSFSFPMVLKPHMSYSDEDPYSRNHVEIVSGENEYHRLMERMLKRGPVAVQRYFRGRGVGVNLLMKDGVPLMVFQQSRVHEPLRGGGGTYRKSTRVSPELLDASLKILSSLNYTGVAMVEFKVSEATGEWMFIEVNARFWGSLPLAIASGADFPLALFQMLAEGRTNFKKDYKVGIYSRQFSSDIAWQIRNIKADRKDPTLLTVSPWKVMLEWAAHIITFKERIDTFALDDQLPFYMELCQSVNRVTSAIWGRIGRRAINNPVTRHISLNYMKKRAAGFKNVLFVCSGNICRSPFAERLTKKYLTSLINVESAGFFKGYGRKSPEEAVLEAQKFGVDLESHRSREITREMVDNADAIFVFDYNNFKDITGKYRYARKRIYFIGSLLPSKSLFLEDPWGKPESFYETVYRNIDEALLVFKKWVDNR